MRNLTLFAISSLLFASCALHTPNTEVSDLRVELSDCPVHGEALIETTQTVDGSRISEHPLYWRFRDALFPVASTPSDDGDLTRVKYCRTCRVAKALCENDKEYNALFWNLPVDDKSRAEHNRKVDGFIERQRQQLNRAMPLPTE
ncbi:MAG: hypothetical protein ISQ06_11655 [Planctomycetaceae bacterium]|nr:hypothetical protein [Planctomycetaceae bacterium]